MLKRNKQGYIWLQWGLYAAVSTPHHSQFRVFYMGRVIGSQGTLGRCKTLMTGHYAAALDKRNTLGRIGLKFRMITAGRYNPQRQGLK